MFTIKKVYRLIKKCLVLLFPNGPYVTCQLIIVTRAPKSFRSSFWEPLVDIVVDGVTVKRQSI